MAEDHPRSTARIAGLIDLIGDRRIRALPQAGIHGLGNAVVPALDPQGVLRIADDVDNTVWRVPAAGQ